VTSQQKFNELRLLMINRLVLLFLLCLSSTVLVVESASADDIVIDTSMSIETHRVFGPEHPGLYKHPASITELAGGDLYIAYYGGAGEYSSETAVFGSRRRHGETKWSMPVTIADTPFRGDGNPVVWQAPDGIVWLFYVNLYGETWSEACVKAKISTDGAKTWSDSFMLTMEKGTMARGKPIVLMNGDYLLPMYFETGYDREGTAADSASYFLRYNPKTKQWAETNRIRSPNGNIQPQVVQLNENDLVCFMRRGGGFGPESSGYILRSESHDGGFKWSEGTDTEFKNPNSAIDVVKLKNGHILLVYNDHMYRRTPLSVAISTDGAKTFPHRRNIGGGDNTFAYPYMIQTSDDKILVLYTTNNRSTIMLAEFEEAAILKYEHE